MRDDEPYSFAATREEINRTSVALLLTDAEVALTFVSIAETTANRESAERNVRNARTAYDSIQRFRTRHVLTDAQNGTLDSRLELVKARLQVLGEKF